ncbi:MAG: fatty acid desaturase [Chitinophagaceae bacterium]|nr:fatty acid desaturase [Chitinophagaceae bacterium]
MQHNLEGITYQEVVNDKGVTYAEFRARLAPAFGKAWFDIAKGYFFLLLTCTSLILLDHYYHSLWWIWVIPFALLTGYIAAYLALFIHEASHFNLHPDKKTNDKLATVFLCLPFGLSIKSYRKIHWQHHLHLGTPQDTEISYFNPLTKLFVLETLTGIHLLRTFFQKEKNTLLSAEQVRQGRLMLVAGVLLHIALLTGMLLSGQWVLAIVWVAGFGIFFPFFATIRQLLEHRDELAHHLTDFRRQPHGKVTRLFVHTILSSSFGAAGFTRHLIHHWDPQASYTRLGEIEQFLLHCDKTAVVVQNSTTTYFATIKKLLSAP